ncbi:MAG: TrbC/VirB2 family protein, partial [Rickettsiales bacterium]|nr:TrbC/VirB2 family protein [Rickettsiales bacterium]
MRIFCWCFLAGVLALGFVDNARSQNPIEDNLPTILGTFGLGYAYMQGSLSPCVYVIKPDGKPRVNRPGEPGYDPFSPYFFILKSGGPVKKIMDCVDYYLFKVADEKLDDIIGIYRFPIVMVITLYVIFLGIRMLFGDIDKPRSEMILPLIMGAAVLYFSSTGVTEYYKVFKAT